MCVDGSVAGLNIDREHEHVILRNHGVVDLVSICGHVIVRTLGNVRHLEREKPAMLVYDGVYLHEAMQSQRVTKYEVRQATR